MYFITLPAVTLSLIPENIFFAYFDLFLYILIAFNVRRGLSMFNKDLFHIETEITDVLFDW